MIHPHQLIGIVLFLTGLGLLVTCLCFRKVATIFKDVYKLIEELKTSPSPTQKLTVPASFIQDDLSVWLVEAALNRLEEIEAPEDIIDLIILYSWAFVNCSKVQPEPDNCPELVNESLIALQKSGWQH